MTKMSLAQINPMSLAHVFLSVQHPCNTRNEHMGNLEPASLLGAPGIVTRSKDSSRVASSNSNPIT